jgi:hypothetical protein
MNTFKTIPLLLASLALVGCASAPPPSSTNSSVDGIDIWKNGHPDRPYQVIATVQREGADNSATYNDEENLLAVDARNRGADAVIVLDTVMVATRRDLSDTRFIMSPKVDAQLIKYE